MYIIAHTLTSQELKIMADQVKLPKREFDESNRIRKEYFKRIQDLSKELQILKNKVEEYANMMDNPRDYT